MESIPPPPLTREDRAGNCSMLPRPSATAGPEVRTRTSMLLRQALQGVCEDGGTELQPRARASLPWHPIARLDRESPRLTLFPRVMPPLNRSPPHTTCGLHLEGYRRSSSSHHQSCGSPGAITPRLKHPPGQVSEPFRRAQLHCMYREGETERRRRRAGAEAVPSNKSPHFRLHIYAYVHRWKAA